MLLRREQPQSLTGVHEVDIVAKAGSGEDQKGMTSLLEFVREQNLYNCSPWRLIKRLRGRRVRLENLHRQFEAERLLVGDGRPSRADLEIETEIKVSEN